MLFVGCEYVCVFCFIITVTDSDFVWFLVALFLRCMSVLLVTFHLFAHTADGAKSSVMMVGLVVTFTCTCILGVGVWRYCKEKSSHTAEWTNAPRKARVLSHGRSAPCVKQGTGT